MADIVGLSNASVVRMGPWLFGSGDFQTQIYHND